MGTSALRGIHQNLPPFLDHFLPTQLRIEIYNAAKNKPINLDANFCNFRLNTLDINNEHSLPF